MTKSDQSSGDDSSTPRVRQLGEPQQVPVFNCHVAVAQPNEKGLVVARILNLNDVQGQGKSERDALQDIIAKFKAYAAQKLADGKDIPWLDKPLQPQLDEQQRWIPVHL